MFFILCIVFFINGMLSQNVNRFSYAPINNSNPQVNSSNSAMDSCFVYVLNPYSKSKNLGTRIKEYLCGLDRTECNLCVQRLFRTGNFFKIDLINLQNNLCGCTDNDITTGTIDLPPTGTIYRPPTSTVIDPVTVPRPKPRPRPQPKFCEDWIIEHFYKNNRIDNVIRRHLCFISKEKCNICANYLQNPAAQMYFSFNRNFNELCKCEEDTFTAPPVDPPTRIINPNPPSPRIQYCLPQYSRGNPRSPHFISLYDNVQLVD